MIRTRDEARRKNRIRKKSGHSIWGHVIVQIPALILIAIPVVKFVGCVTPKALDSNTPFKEQKN